MTRNLLLALIVLSSFTVQATNVCVYIDVGDTSPDKQYPDMASDVDDYQSWFEVHHGEITCFDLAKQYYMQYYLYERPGHQIWYGTKCKYEPKPEHEGKTLVYKGDNGSSICPVVDRKP
jgi:hypothetical protein